MKRIRSGNNQRRKIDCSLSLSFFLSLVGNRYRGYFLNPRTINARLESSRPLLSGRGRAIVRKRFRLFFPFIVAVSLKENWHGKGSGVLESRGGEN